MREGFVVRVLRAGSAVPAGVGFVVGDRQVLTCAHVVNTALGRSQRDQQAPGAQLRVQVVFPLLGDPEGAPLRSCRVEAWAPPPVSGAVLTELWAYQCRRRFRVVRRDHLARDWDVVEELARRRLLMIGG
jgi:hypothetical protein